MRGVDKQWSVEPRKDQSKEAKLFCNDTRYANEYVLVSERAKARLEPT